MKGQICLVTGATAGIGEITARELARMGAQVIIVGRSAERAQASAARIQAAVGVTPDILLADLSSQQAIHQLAEAFSQRYPQLDVLVNNAGAIYNQRLVSVDGIEMTLALNHMSYFLLTNLLLDRLKAAPRARVVNVASQAHAMASGLNSTDPQFSRGYNAWRVYGHSKLANILFTNELARRLSGTQVTANSLHPGFVASNFGQNNRDFMTLMLKVAQRFGAITPEEGAKTSIYLASSADVSGISGAYFDSCKAVQPSAAARDATAAKKLWEISESLSKIPLSIA